MRILVLVVALLLAAPAVAAETAWQELSPGVKARLVSSDVRAADGTTLVALELDMPTGTKTYWRVPGESGIPPDFDFSASVGLGGETVAFPYPTRDTTAGFLDYVYFGPTVFPMTLAVAADQPAQVVLNATLGVCSDVCVPAQASFTLPLGFTKADAGNRLRINQALATTPLPWDGADPISDVTLDAEGLTLTQTDPSLDPDSFIADVGDPAVVFGTPQKGPDGRSVFLPLLASSAGSVAEGKPLHITFMTDRGPYEVIRRIGTD